MMRITRLSLSKEIQKSSIFSGLYFSFTKSKVLILRSNRRNRTCFVLYDTLVSWNQEKKRKYFLYFFQKYSSEVKRKMKICMYILIFLLNSLSYFREKYKKYLRFIPDSKIPKYHTEEKHLLFLLFDLRINTFDFVKEKYKPVKILDFCTFLERESLVILVMF